MPDYSPGQEPLADSGGSGGGRKGKATRIASGDDDYSNFNKIMAAISRLEQRTGQLPTVSELANETMLSVFLIVSILTRFLPENDLASANRIRTILQLEGFSTGHVKAKKELETLVYSLVDRFYCIAFIGTLDNVVAEDLTDTALRAAMNTGRQVNPKRRNPEPFWDLASNIIVDAIADWHREKSQFPSGPITDPTIDGSSQMDWETSVILGTQRVKRCIAKLPEEQKKAFILRHQLNLGFSQVAAVLNENEDNIMAWLHRARVQLVKCLGRG